MRRVRNISQKSGCSMTKRVLITGGAGFIGSHLTDALLARGYAVRILDSLAPQVHCDQRRPAYLSREADGGRRRLRPRSGRAVTHQCRCSSSPRSSGRCRPKHVRDSELYENTTSALGQPPCLKLWPGVQWLVWSVPPP